MVQPPNLRRFQNRHAVSQSPSRPCCFRSRRWENGERTLGKSNGAVFLQTNRSAECVRVTSRPPPCLALLVPAARDKRCSGHGEADGGAGMRAASAGRAPILLRPCQPCSNRTPPRPDAASLGVGTHKPSRGCAGSKPNYFWGNSARRAVRTASAAYPHTFPATADLSQTSLLLPQPSEPGPSPERARGAPPARPRGRERGKVEP